MDSKTLRAKLETTGRTSDEINTIIEKFEKSLKNRDAIRFQLKSSRVKVRELMESMNLNKKDCRFFDWGSPAIGIFVHRGEKTAKVSFSFLNAADIRLPEYNRNDFRATHYHALLNYNQNRYTYEVEWRGRSEFAAYDAFIKNHRNFPNRYKDLLIGIGIFTLNKCKR